MNLENEVTFMSADSDSLTNLLNISEDEYSKRLEISQSYLDCAKSDLVASKVLNEHKLNALSIYHLQQAVEKTSKCFGILFFSISPGKLHK